MKELIKLQDIIYDNLNAVVHKDTPLKFLNLKLIEFIQLHLDIYEVFKVNIKTKELNQKNTIQDIVNIIKEKQCH